MMLYVDEVYPFKIQIKDPDGDLYDPATSVLLTVLVSSVTKVDAQLMTNETTGVYSYNTTLDVPGRWYFSVKATDGSVVNIEKWSFKVSQNLRG
jgi:hypothetical protein